MNRKRRIGHRVLVFMLSLTLFLSLPLFTPFNSYGASKFRDTSGHWAEGFITRAYDQNVINGYPDGRFYPDKSVSRAEFVTMINNAFQINIDYDGTNFKDVPYNKWYYKAVSTAITATYTIGFSDNTFHPDTPITRQEAAVMLSNILPNYKGGGNLKSYRDYRLIANWATAALEKMTGREYFGAYNDGKLHPTDPLTRAQAAKILTDILDNETIVTRRTTIDEDGTTLSERIYTDDVTIDEDLGEGSATIDNSVILGKLIVEGGGSSSITINNSRVASAVVDKEDSAVRIVTKGSTVIYRLSASQKSILQTAGKDGYGILDVTVNKGADVTMRGNFPVVNIVGSSAVVALESGKISTLTVTGAGKYSDITLTGKAQILEATVNAEAYFHGEGVIAHMSVNADDVTYETKPTKMTVATTVDRALEEGLTDFDVSFKPRHKSTGVDVDTQITLTFSTSMKLAGGKAISDSNIKDFVSLKENSRDDGADIEFTASINSAKKVITLTPKSELSTSTRYYVILEDEALENSGGTKNDGAYIYFTTSEEGGSTSATFSPANGAANVSATASIKIKFAEAIVKSSDGSAVTSAYLQECVQFKSGGSGGASVPFTASISSSDTVTITPNAGLTAGQTYYVGIVADKLKTKDGGRAIPAASATWTVAPAAPPTPAVLTGLTVSPAGGSNLLTGFSGTTTTYSVTMPFGTTNIDIRTTAASGITVQINGASSGAALNHPLPSSSETITIVAAASGKTPTTYTVNVQVAENTNLSGLSVDGSPLSPDSPGSSTYSVNVDSSAATAAISITAVDPNAVINLGSNSGTGTLATNVSLDPGDQTITFTVTSNTVTKTYTVHFIRV